MEQCAIRQSFRCPEKQEERIKGEDLRTREHEERNSAANAGRTVPPGKAGGLKPVDYIRAMNLQIMEDNQHGAYAVLKHAIERYPDDPFLLSSYGSLQAIVDKKYRKGIENCIRAIELFKKKSLSNRFERCAVFYLNLGRAYLAAGKKKDAINAFKTGLQYDGGYAAIEKKLEKLGTRKKPAVPFLDRSNPINKYLGMILHQEKKKHPAGMMIKSGT